MQVDVRWQIVVDAFGMPDVRHHIIVGQHYALGFGGSARRVEESQKLVIADLRCIKLGSAAGEQLFVSEIAFAGLAAHQDEALDALETRSNVFDKRRQLWIDGDSSRA